MHFVQPPSARGHFLGRLVPAGAIRLGVVADQLAANLRFVNPRLFRLRQPPLRHDPRLLDRLPANLRRVGMVEIGAGSLLAAEPSGPRLVIGRHHLRRSLRFLARATRRHKLGFHIFCDGNLRPLRRLGGDGNRLRRPAGDALARPQRHLGLRRHARLRLRSLRLGRCCRGGCRQFFRLGRRRRPARGRLLIGRRDIGRQPATLTVQIDQPQRKRRRLGRVHLMPGRPRLLPLGQRLNLALHVANLRSQRPLRALVLLGFQRRFQFRALAV